MHLTGLVLLPGTSKMESIGGPAERAVPSPVKGRKMPAKMKSADSANGVDQLSGTDLGMCVAREVMGWRLDCDQITDSWVDENDKLTGYYYGRPFSPYRDRNALREVLRRIEQLGMRDEFLERLTRMMAIDSSERTGVAAWALLTCPPELACRAAILTVRK